MDVDLLNVISLSYIKFIDRKKETNQQQQPKKTQHTPCFKNVSVSSTEYWECSQNFSGPHKPIFKVKEG